MLTDEELQLGDQVGVLPGVEIGRNARLDRGQPFLFKTDRLGGEAGVLRDPGERLAPPQPQPPIQSLGRNDGTGSEGERSDE